MKKIIVLLIFIICAVGQTRAQDISQDQKAAIIQLPSENLSKCESDCTSKGITLKGKVKVVESFPDLKVRIVNSFEDIDVKNVSSFPDDCGEWQFVESFPDFTIQFVESFPDLTIKFVDSFPGMKN